MRIFSIGSKIFAIAVSLVALMVVVSGVSAYMVDRVRSELEFQAAIFVPLSNRITSIETSVLEGEVLLERLRHALEEDRLAYSVVEIENDLLIVDNEIIEGFKRANEILRSLDIAELSKESAIAATRLTAALETIESEYRSYYSAMDKLLTANKKGDTGSMILMNDILIEEEQRIYSQLERTRSQMQTYVSNAIAAIVRLDNILDVLILVLTGVASLLGLLFSVLVTRRITGPMQELVAGLKRVEGGDLESELKISTRDETAHMAQGFNSMVAGLRAKERITETFGKYVDARVVDSLIGNPAMTRPGGDRRHMTIMFTDIKGFTSLSEKLSPDILVNFLNAYFTEMAEPIQACDGVIDKFIGDAIMAYWGPPFVDPQQQAKSACVAGLEQLALIQGLQGRMHDILGVKLDVEPINIRIGIASGPALVGTVGSIRHRNYTVMGDTVNLAARLEGACKAYGLRLLVDEATMADTDGILFREIDALQVKGKTEPIHIYEPMTELPGTHEQITLARCFERALAEYRVQNLAAAEKSFQKCLEIDPQDGPASVFLDRIQALSDNPMPVDWNGVWVMTSK